MKYDKNQPSSIQNMFGSIAKNYDRANAILSFGLHKSWNKALIKKVSQYPCDHLLDLCAGTGDIAFLFAKKHKQFAAKIYLLDFCHEMLEGAKKKALQQDFRHDFHYLHADAQKIPLAEASIQVVTTAYGIRNVKNLAQCAQEVFRVLKPQGVWGILELTQPRRSLLRFGHGIYLSSLLPKLGKFVAKDQNAYDYLARSIQEFIEPEKIKHLLLDHGFKMANSYPLMGGVATIILCQKP